jgi:hypothetical protein
VDLLMIDDCIGDRQSSNARYTTTGARTINIPTASTGSVVYSAVARIQDMLASAGLDHQVEAPMAAIIFRTQADAAGAAASDAPATQTVAIA